MKRKTLISIALVLIMLLNCIMPLFVVNAAEGEEIQLNSKLFAAVKESLSEQGISFSANNVTHTLTLSGEEIASITKLNLNEKGIYDLTGLEKFTSLQHLELSGNNLTKDSNLEALNSLPLNHLDLSTNSIEDVSAIDELINTINSNNGKVILTSQTVTIVEEASINIEEDSDNELTATFSLPPILEKADFIKSAWIKKSGISEDNGYVFPTVEEMSNPVNAENNFYKVKICSDQGEYFKGLLKLEIYIHDDSTEASSSANVNPASKNLLNGSRFYIYVVVHDSTTTAIHTPDSNLYKAIKEQLTAGQTDNPFLDSYPYGVDVNGETIYEECTYTDGNNGDKLLTVIGEEKPKYVVRNNKAYIIDYDGDYKYPDQFYSGQISIDDKNYYIYSYDTILEKTNIKTVGKNGVIEYKEGYKIAIKGENRSLYVKAYDEARTFVIKKEDLINKITNLIINNKEIRNLEGIQEFVGLESYLNVSHNYLTDIEPIYNLQENKISQTAKLQEEFSKYLQTREYGNLSKSLTETKTNKKSADEEIKKISETVEAIMTKFKEASEIEEFTEKQVTTQTEGGQSETKTEKVKNENYEKDLEAKAKEIDDLIKNIYGYDQKNETTNETTHVKGYIENLHDYLDKTTSSGKELYTYLSKLYNIYNKDYKLATILTPELNYQNIEEYLAYKKALLGTSESVKNLYLDELNRLAGYYTENSLTDIEKDIILKTIGISDSDDDSNPISNYIKDDLSKIPGDRIQWANRIEKIREAALYIEMINYCMIKRMEEPTLSSQCYIEEYLTKRIEDFGYEGINTDFEQKVLSSLKEDTTLNDDIFNLVKKFIKEDYTYTKSSSEANKIKKCMGEYTQFEIIFEEHTNYASNTEIAEKINVDSDDKEVKTVYDKLKNKDIIKTLTIKESIDDKKEFKGDLNLYKEVTALAGKFVQNSGEVSRYITLPQLKKLDISYNAYLEGMERLPELTGLRELYANANYITDLTNVNWESMKYLRKLGLAYNYITNIEPLEVLENIVEIDASHNLIAGEFKFNFTKSQKTLMKLDLSYNQIDDITSLMKWLDMWSSGDDGNYLAREDTIDIRLQNQTLNIEVPDVIYLDEYPETFDFDLPKIFTQLVAIDVDRTAFGKTSQNGRIESEGRYVTLNTRTVGEKEGVVTVVAMNGNGKSVDTCVGEGTTAYIKYVVDNRKATSVKIEPSENVSVNAGETLQFTGETEGTKLTDTSVAWSIDGNSSDNTTISNDGLLTVAEDETAEKITVTATSNFDNSVSTTVEVTVNVKSTERTVKVEPSENVSVKVGETLQFTGKTQGEDIEDTSVTWSVSGSENENTTISDEGLLTVAENETAEKITVTATSKADETVKTNVEVTITKEDKDPSTHEHTWTWKVDKEPTCTEEGTKHEECSCGEKQSEGTVIPAKGHTFENGKCTVCEAKDPNYSAGVDIVLGYNTKDEYIVGVAPKTSVEDFKKIVLNGENYTVVIKKDEEDITSGYMTTGMYVHLLDESNNPLTDKNGDILAYEVVVTGDVNGDGYANSLDSILIKSHRTDVKQLQAEALLAADINNDGRVNATDSKLLLYHRAEVSGYDLNYKK